MDPTRCIEPEELEETLALPEDDPRRGHLATCPKCRALVGSHALFLSAEGGDEPHVRKADAQLTAFRERMLGLDPAGAAPAPARQAKSPPGPWWQALLAPAARPAWAFAAIAVLAGAVVLWNSRGPAPGTPTTLRGGTAEPMRLHPPDYRPDGGVEISWEPFAGADHYEVRFFSTALTELGRCPAVTSNSARITSSGLPRDSTHIGVVLYRVFALRGGDEVAQSPVGTLQER